MAYFDKNEVVGYIIDKHLEINNGPISPIKLQKTLYILYAMWAGNAKNINDDMDNMTDELGVCEQDEKYCLDLFEPNFEAWKYGPVDRDVYSRYKERTIETYSGDILNGNSSLSNIKAFMDDIISQCFEINDFALVDLTHMDECWKTTYNRDPSGSTKILKDSIIKEYSDRLS